MKFILDNFSIVILAESHNPSILNPDFLKNEGIVDPSFTATNIFCTQPVSQIAYQEGIIITTEFEKLQLVDAVSSRIPFDSPIPDIATKYVRKLPFVRYKAVGLNFTGHYGFTDPKAAINYLPNFFLKEGKWSSYGAGMPMIGIKFTYSFPTYKCLISVDTAETIPPDQTEKGAVIVTANYHSDLNNLDDIAAFIDDWKKHYNHLGKIIDDTFPEKKL